MSNKNYYPFEGKDPDFQQDLDALKSFESFDDDQQVKQSPMSKEALKKAFSDMGEERTKTEGQQLLDHFATAALTGLITNINNFDYLRDKTATNLSMDAYTIAEAMLAERERRMENEK